MTKKKSAARPAAPRPDGGSSFSIGGNVGGSLVSGNSNIVVDNVGAGAVITVGSNNQVFSSSQRAALSQAATPQEIAALSDLFQALNQKIAQEAPADLKAEAVRQAGQLQQAVAADKPNVSAMTQAKTWFADNLPAIAGAVTGLLTNPIVGKLVEAAGEFTIGQFRERLGLPPKA